MGKQMRRRRKRSHLTKQDCLGALEVWAGKVQRMMETSEGFLTSQNCEPGTIKAAFLLEGNFGTTDDMFEAIRVLAGHKLPAKEKPHA